MATQLDIVSPERLMVSEQVTSVTMPGTEGYFTVLGDHAPLITVLKPGFVTVVGAGGASQVIFVLGGLVEVTGAGVTILADGAKPAAELSREEIDGHIATAQKALDAAQTPEDKAAAQHDLDQWRNLLLELASVSTVH
jgi:F-type H+-transporting ATPase subunit epsilon